MATEQDQHFTTPLAAAEECVRRKWPGRNWENEADYQKAVRYFYSLVQDAEFHWHFPKLRYGVAEAEQRAKDGCLRDTWAVLSVHAPAYLADNGSWLWKRFHEAFIAGDWLFVNTVMQGMASYYRRSQSKKNVAEPHKDFLVWFLVNKDKLEKLTAEEQLREWAALRCTLPTKVFGVVPTFKGDNAIFNFRRWLSRHGFKLGMKGKTHHRKV